MHYRQLRVWLFFLNDNGFWLKHGNVSCCSMWSLSYITMQALPLCACLCLVSQSSEIIINTVLLEMRWIYRAGHRSAIFPPLCDWRPPEEATLYLHSDWHAFQRRLSLITHVCVVWSLLGAPRSSWRADTTSNVTYRKHVQCVSLPSNTHVLEKLTIPSDNS